MPANAHPQPLNAARAFPEIGQSHFNAIALIQTFKISTEQVFSKSDPGGCFRQSQKQQSYLLVRPGRRAPNRGNVVEDPLWDRIADGGNPGCQGQVATRPRRS